MTTTKLIFFFWFSQKTYLPLFQWDRVLYFPNKKQRHTKHQGGMQNKVSIVQIQTSLWDKILNRKYIWQFYKKNQFCSLLRFFLIVWDLKPTFHWWCMHYKSLPLLITIFLSSSFNGLVFSQLTYFRHSAFWDASKGIPEGGVAGMERLKPTRIDSISWKNY